MKTHGLRHLAKIATVAALVIGTATMAAPAQAATPRVTLVKGLSAANVRAAATTASKIVAVVKKDQYVTLLCYMRGQAVSGLYNRNDNLWYRIGTGKYISDTTVNTGGTRPVTPACTSTAPAPTAGRYNAGIVKAANAIKDGSYGGQCAIFVENMIRKAGGPSVALGSSNGSGYQTAWAKYATRIASLSQARPGDVVQYYTPGKGPHTAILLSGTSVATALERDSNFGVASTVGGAGDRKGGLVYTHRVRDVVSYFGTSSYMIWRLR